MSTQTQPARDYLKLTVFTSDIPLDARAVMPVGGTQFVFETLAGAERTIPAADYAIVFARDVQCIRIDSATDCTEVHIWR